jgi:hypothetical protein
MLRKKHRVFGKRANPEKWRPVIVRDALSVKALNTLFRKGWYLMDLEMDDLPYLAFQISTEGERPQKKRRPGELIPYPLGIDQTLILILTKGNIHRQRAVLLEPDERGYRDIRRHEEELARVAAGWEPIQMFSMENRCSLAILEREELEERK